MSYLRSAQDIAKKYHAKQEYFEGNQGYPYFERHIEGVVKILKDMGYEDKVLATAYLHDVIEDTPLTGEDLKKLGIPQDIVNAVVALTKDKANETNNEYIARLMCNKLAIPVKFADSNFNLKNTQNNKNKLTKKRYEHLRLKYESNLKTLEPIMPKPEELL